MTTTTTFTPATVFAKSMNNLLGYVASSEAERSHRTALSVVSMYEWMNATSNGDDLDILPDDVRTAVLGVKADRKAAMKKVCDALASMSPAAAKDAARLSELGNQMEPATAKRKKVPARGLIGEAAAEYRAAAKLNNPSEEAKALHLLADLEAEREEVAERLAKVKRAHKVAIERVITCAAFIDGQPGLRNPLATAVGKNKAASLHVESLRDGEWRVEPWSMAKLNTAAANHVKNVIDSPAAASLDAKEQGKPEVVDAPENDTGKRGPTASPKKPITPADAMDALADKISRGSYKTDDDKNRLAMLHLFTVLRDVLSPEQVAAYDAEYADKSDAA